MWKLLGFKSLIEPEFRSCRKRGGILEQRRRPTVKFQSHFALSHVVAIRLDIPFEAPLIDSRCLCSEAETHRLRYGRVAPRAFCRSQLRNPGRVESWPITGKIIAMNSVLFLKRTHCIYLC